MLAKKHKNLKKRIKGMEISACFHLDEEEEDLAHNAKRELELCSFEDHYEDFHRNQENEAKNLNKFQPICQDSIRTTATCHDQSVRVKSRKKQVSSKYMKIPTEASRQKSLPRPKTTKEYRKISNVTLSNYSPNLSNLQKEVNKLSIKNTAKFEKSKNNLKKFTNNFMSLSERRYHQDQLSCRKKLPLSKNRFYTNPKEELHYPPPSSTFFSFNDAIQNYDPLKVRTERSHQKNEQKVEDPKTSRQQVSLRPEFLKLINKIKQKEEHKMSLIRRPGHSSHNQ